LKEGISAMRAPTPARGFAVGLLALAAVLVGCDSNPPAFRKIDGAWHYKTLPIPGSDAGSFKPLSDHYAKDRARVYYGDSYRDGKEYYAVKHDRVTVVEHADAATFVYIDRGYAKDAASVFFEGTRFPVKDVSSFELLDYGFAQDRITGYYHQAEVAGSDGSTFAAIDTHYSKDRARVFYSIIETDAGVRRAHVRTMPLPDARVASFVSLDSGYAKDAVRAYHRDRVLTSDTSTFATLSHDYAKTATQVFYRGDVVAGAAASTFRVIDPPSDDADAQDANARYRLGRRGSPARRSSGMP
jgi:hypothetical protein